MLALEDQALMSTCVQHFLRSIKEVTVIDLEKTANFYEDSMQFLYGNLYIFPHMAYCNSNMLQVSTDRVTVLDSSGSKVEAQLLPISNATLSVRNYYVRAYLGESPKEAVKYWLAFSVSVPPIGFSTYIISTGKQTGQPYYNIISWYILELFFQVIQQDIMIFLF